MIFGDAGMYMRRRNFFVLEWDSSVISEALPGESHTRRLNLDREPKEDQRNDYSEVQLAKLNWVTSRTMGRGYFRNRGGPNAMVSPNSPAQHTWCRSQSSAGDDSRKRNPLSVGDSPCVFPSSCLQFLEPWERPLGNPVPLSPPRHALFTS